MSDEIRQLVKGETEGKWKEKFDKCAEFVENVKMEVVNLM
jgi:hypothetical protein